MAESVEGKVVVVTGASMGVGRATARAFGKKHCRVGLVARNEEALRRAADEIRAAGGEALVLPTDTSDADAVERAAAAVEQKWGTIDVWVNDAMVTVFSPVMKMTPAEYERVTEVSYLGYVYGTLAALKRMVPRDRGIIVQIGSALVYRSIPLQSAYCGAKAAIRGFTDSLRCELLHDKSNVKVTILELPAVNTPQFRVQRNKLAKQAQPVPPIYAPSLIADAAVWAAEHHPREMVLAGSSLRAILAQKLIPGLLDRYLAKFGYSSQETGAPNDPTRPGNLFDVVPGDHGAEGPFTDEEHESSIEVTLREHPRATAGAAIAAVGGLAALATRRS